MSLLLLIVFGLLLAATWQEVRGLRDRIAVLEAIDRFAPPIPDPKPIETRSAVRPTASRRSGVSEPLTSGGTSETGPDIPAPFAEQSPAPVAPQPPAQIDRDDPQPRGIVPAPSRFEDVLGRRLAIWTGGLTLAVTGALVVRYSIEAGLLSPIVRILLGLVFGAGLIGAAEAALRREDRVRDPRIRQALAGAGIATLYAATLAAANLYGLIGPAPAFVGMAAVTGLAALLSLRFGAPSALLGLVGGLAAPVLVGADAPDVPLLTLYLALTVGGLCALGRQQRWWWLGGAALVGGFGWGALLIVGGVVDLAATLSIGAYTLALAVALPMLLIGDRTGPMRLAAAALGCAQIAAIVALGGFAPLHWGLFGLLSVAILWLSRREPLFSDVPALALGVAILLGLIWPGPTDMGIALLSVGLVLVHALPAARRVWRVDSLAIDAPMVAAVAAALGVIPAAHTDGAGLATLAGAALSASVAVRGWRIAGRADDARFAILAITAVLLVGMAGAQLLPAAAWASVAALLCAASLALADAAKDRRIERAGWLFGSAALILLGIDQGVTRLGGFAVPAHPGAWIVPALVAAAIALRVRGARSVAVQPAAIVVAYGVAAQLVAIPLLPLVPVAILVGLASTRRGTELPGATSAGVLALAWTIVPLVNWGEAALTAASGLPVAVREWPTLVDAASRLAGPGAAIALACLSLPLPGSLRRYASIAGATLVAVAVHTGWRHAVPTGSWDTLAMNGMMARAVWEALLAGAAITAWQIGRRNAAVALGVAALAHVVWFTGIMFNPLAVELSAGPWLALSYAVAGGLLWLASRAWPGWARARDVALMVLATVAAFTLLRQASHTPMPLWAGTGADEQIARSVLALALAGTFLGVGIVRQARDWRIASLILMLATVAKVFLLDVAGLDGLLRIAAFAALGFSLIGVGWLYGRYLPDHAR